MSHQQPGSSYDFILYYVDRWLSGHPAGRLMLLSVLSLVVIVSIAVLRFVISLVEHGEAFHESLWWSLLATLDPVKFADEVTPMTRLVGLVSSLLGLVVVASLIGIVNNSIDDRIDQLKKGRAPVIATDHTLILNWNQERVLAILSQLIGADHASGHGRTFVILSTEDKSEVEDVLQHKLHHELQVDIVVRTGDPGDAKTLLYVGADRAKEVIIMNPELTLDNTETRVLDMPVVRSLLALRHLPTNRLKSVVAEISSRDRVPLLMHIGGDKLQCIIMSEVLSRVLVQCARFRFLAQIYETLLDESEGHENVDFYVRDFPQLDGMAFGAVQARLYNAVAIGYERTDPETKKTSVHVNPPTETKLTDRDRLIFLCSSPSAQFGLAREMKILDGMPATHKQPHAPEYFAIVGYSGKLMPVVVELDRYLSPGSIVYVLAGARRETGQFPTELKNLRIQYIDGDPTDEETLQRLAVVKNPPQCVMVLARDDCTSHNEVDAKTTISVLQLSFIFSQMSNVTPPIKPPRVICEIVDSASRLLLDQDVGCEFVLSTEVISRLIAQAADERSVAEVFADLFDEAGSEIYLKSPLFYTGGHLDTPIPWLSIVAAAASKNEIVIGFVKDDQIRLSPVQSISLSLSAKDKVVVISEDDGEYVD